MVRTTPAKADRRWRGLLLGVLAILVHVPAPLDAQVAAGMALVRGRVVEFQTEASLPGATVSLTDREGTVHTRVSAEDGVFAFRPLPPGLYHMSVELLGYATLSDTLTLSPSSTADMTLPLSVSPVPLAPAVVAVSRYPVGPLRGFERRAETLRGTFMTREDIETADVEEFSDLIRTVPGVRFVPTGAMGMAMYFRNGCVPDVWLDGVRVEGNVDVDDFLRPDHLEALEVYHGAETPGEFGGSLCGAVVAWSRRGSDSTTKRSLPTQLLYAGAFALLVVLAR